MTSEEVRRKHKEWLFPATANYYAEPIVIDRAKGLRVTDKDGRTYLDFFGGILTVSMGHCEPRITGRVTEQLQRLQHTSTLYPNEWIVGLAERLAQITPGALRKSFFTNSGSEADETAIALARMHTGVLEIVALRHGYSGRTLVASNLTAHAAWRQPSLVPGIKHAPAPYCYRCPFGLTYPSCEVRCARDIEELIQTETTGQVAAMLAEPILGVGGFVVPPKEYFQIAAEIVRKFGGLFIADEVQTGFGRTGGKWFGIEHYGVEPDIMTFAKGLANGAPIGCTIARAEIADSWKGATISTFGGNPVSMVAALATLDVMTEEDVPARALSLGARLRQGIEALKEKYHPIGDVRGIGLMQALELVEDRQTKAPAAKRAVAVMEAARKRGLLIGKGGLYGNVLRIAPPMLVDASEIDEAVRALDGAFQDTQ